MSGPPPEDWADLLAAISEALDVPPPRLEGRPAEVAWCRYHRLLADRARAVRGALLVSDVAGPADLARAVRREAEDLAPDYPATGRSR